MLMNEETFQKFGYYADNLTGGSNKKVVTKCDYCGQLIDVVFKIRNKSNSVVDKDSCKKCKYEKRRDISIAQYGVANSAQRDDVRQKISENCAFKQEGFEEKRNRTMLKKYGVLNAMDSKKLKNRQQQAIRDKYGVDNISQCEEVQQKKKDTNLAKYGNEQFLASEEGRRRVKQGMLDKYGVENPFQAEEVKEKIKKTSLKKYGYEHHLKNKEKALENAQKMLKSKIKSGKVRLYDGKSISEWLKEIEYSSSRFRVLIKKHGFEEARRMTPHVSSLEQKLSKWLKDNNIEYISHFKVGNKFADFLLPKHNIIIEVDGLYWHSEFEQKNKYYHVEKRGLYEANGYTSLFFRENEIEDKFAIVSSIILNKVGKSNKLFARKCSVVYLDKNEAKEFFNNNHLMSSGGGKTIALKYDGKTVSAMQFRRTVNKYYEISRFCNLINMSVVGGFSRLLSYFIKHNSVDSIRTYIDQRYGSGSYLEEFGFELKNNDISFYWTDGNKVFHRMKFRGDSGYNFGLRKIWDCGQARYDKIIHN